MIMKKTSLQIILGVIGLIVVFTGFLGILNGVEDEYIN